MIVQKQVTIKGKELIHTYSSSGYYIKKVGTNRTYTEAYDVTQVEYEETDKKIPFDEKRALKLTRGDVFRGLLKAKGITRAQIRGVLEAMPERTQQQKLEKELALIDFDEALYFYRDNPLIDNIGVQLGITKERMTRFFETNDYTQLIG